MSLARGIAANLGRAWRETLGVRSTGWRAPDAARMPLSVEQVLGVDPRRRLSLVRCGARRLLLLTGGPHDVLTWLPGSDDPAP